MVDSLEIVVTNAAVIPLMFEFCFNIKNNSNSLLPEGKGYDPCEFLNFDETFSHLHTLFHFQNSHQYMSK